MSLRTILGNSKVQAILDDILDERKDHFNIPTHLDRFDHIHVLAIGGPALCGEVLQSMSPHPERLIFWDNLDSESITNHLQAHKLEKCGFLVLSKSGQTLETLVEFSRVVETLKERKLNSHDHVLVATEDSQNPLREQAQEHGIPWVELSKNIDGRFSILSRTGQILANYLCIDFRKVRSAARDLLQDATSLKNYYKDIYKHGKNIARQDITEHVFFSYTPKLAPLLLWWSQLTGESLGKKGKGLTPIIAFGPKDQHSQLQLYLGGPRNKFFTFLNSHQHDHNTFHASFHRVEDLPIDQITAIQLYAVMETFKEQLIPARLVQVDLNDTAQMGELLLQIMMEIWIFADRLKVDPFGQPDIEKVKQKVWDLLQRI